MSSGDSDGVRNRHPRTSPTTTLVPPGVSGDRGLFGSNPGMSVSWRCDSPILNCAKMPDMPASGPDSYIPPISAESIPTRVEPLTSTTGPSRGSVAFVISLVVGVLADTISKENKQEWDNSLNYDRYRPGRSGIAVYDAPVYPCRCAKGYGAGKNINH